MSTVQELTKQQNKISDFILRNQSVKQESLYLTFASTYVALGNVALRPFNTSRPTRPILENVFSAEQVRALAELVKACLDYLLFHNNTERTLFYRVLASHGKTGKSRALSIINRIAEFTFTHIISQDSDSRINDLRRDLIGSSHSLYEGEHSLSAYLKRTPEVTALTTTKSRLLGA